MEKSINVRGVDFNNESFDGIVSLLMSRLDEKKQTALFTPNSEIVQLCIDDNSLYEIINSGDVVIPDGIGVVKAAKILGTPFRYGKVAGIEVGAGILEKVSGTSHKVFLLGGKPGIAELAKEKLLLKHPGIVFAGTNDGYFKKEGEENDKIIEKINESGADVLFVCLGAPAQEKWIYNNRSKLENVNLMMGLGGSLDGYAETVKRAPRIFIKLGLEWFYRLLKEPKRIGRMMKLPKFYFGTILYKLKKK